MPEHDPFPMSSTQAQQLASSVRDANSNVGWNSMNTSSAESGPKDDVISSLDQKTASQGLMGGKKAASAAGYTLDDDIYLQQQQQNSDMEKEDEFLDRPMWESRGKTAFEKRLVQAGRLLERIYVRLYGDKLPPSEMLRTLCLATTLFFMIGGYWLLRSLKDPIVTALCGVQAIPKAKMLSVFVVLAVVSIYNHFLDSDIPRHKLFYIFGSFYCALFISIALLLMHPTIGLANEQPSPWRVLGWISYCSIESFGSVMVSLFWSFANSNFSLETAKASYGVMVATAQVGSILGPTVVSRYGRSIGVAKCYLIGALCMLLLQGTMFSYIRIYGTADRNGKPVVVVVKKKEKPGILEGLRLFVKHNYIKGIFAISCLFMIEVTIVDFTMKLLARDFFSEKDPCEVGMSCYDSVSGKHGMSHEATAEFTAFMGFFGQATNTLSLLLSLFGTSAVIRFFGLRLTLLLFPTLCLCVIIFVRLYPTLYVVFGAMMTLKACSYALNNPTKEILYQPTSAAVRYKAKSWIDIFGARGSKAMGSVVTNAFSDSAANLVANGSFVGMAVASFLIWNARFMGGKFDEYTASGFVVGEEPSAGMEQITDEDTNLEMAVAQNDVEDTSCAINDDDEISPEEEGQGSTGGSAVKANVQMV
jgi:ATP:ADP antiporter, AAA family